MAKTCWLRHLAEVIHNTSFLHKEVWDNIGLLIKREEGHRSYQRTIQMRLLSEELAKTDEDNVKVFSVHFGKVLNDMKRTDDRVINDIQL